MTRMSAGLQRPSLIRTSSRACRSRWAATGRDGRIICACGDIAPGAGILHTHPFSTGERDTLLGETCEIWRTAHENDPPSAHRLSCVTADGVELWSRTISSSGEIISSTRATSLVRRRVDASEVRPPADAFDWEMWRSALPATRHAPNDEVILMSSVRRPVVIRRRAGWTYRSGQGWLSFDPDIRRIELSHEAGLFLRYDADSDGPLELNIERSPVEREVVGSPEGHETLLGERCTWLGVAHHFECRTRDGLLLWARMSGDFTPARVEFKAMRIRRGDVLETDMQPPAEAFAWGRAGSWRAGAMRGAGETGACRL